MSRRNSGDSLTLTTTASGLISTGEVSADFHNWNTGTGYVEIVSDSTVWVVRVASSATVVIA